MILKCPGCEKKLRISDRSKAKKGRCSCGTIVSLFPVVDTQLISKATGTPRPEEETPTDIICPVASMPVAAPPRRVEPQKRPILPKAPSLFPSPQPRAPVQVKPPKRKPVPVKRISPPVREAPSVKPPETNSEEDVAGWVVLLAMIGMGFLVFCLWYWYLASLQG